MNTYDKIYETKQLKSKTEQEITEFDDVKYVFISKGEKDIIKLVHYSFLEELDEKKVFNLGFGDYNFSDNTIVDDVNSNNGDMYTVFNTVLCTVPRFFEIHKDALMTVKGSDSGSEFITRCRACCRKNCTDVCRNVNRRINIYKGYVDKNFDELKMDYTFYGKLDKIDNKSVMIDYEPGNKYESVFLRKN